MTTKEIIKYIVIAIALLIFAFLFFRFLDPIKDLFGLLPQANPTPEYSELRKEINAQLDSMQARLDSVNFRLGEISNLETQKPEVIKIYTEKYKSIKEYTPSERINEYYKEKQAQELEGEGTRY